MDIPKTLRSILSATGWTQEILARQLGVSFPTLNSWINGKSHPRKKAIERISELRSSVIGSTHVDKKALSELKKHITDQCLIAEQIVSDASLLDTLTLHLTYHTNTIEGSTMTLSDVEDVIFDNKVLSNRTAIEQAEARNHQAALHWLLDEMVHLGKEFVVTDELIKSVHVRLMNGIISDAGLYRNHSVRIMGSKTVLVNWVKIPDLLMRLLQESGPTDDPIHYIAAFHAEFERIHPFSDGNGRTGRLVMLAQALHCGLVPPIIQKERKHAYYAYLEQAQTQNRIEPLEKFVAESVNYSAGVLGFGMWG